MAAELKFFKLTVVPGTWEPSSVYFILNGGYSETYVTDNSGTAKAVGNSAMINALIASQLSAVNSVKVVADIAARNALNPTTALFVLVKAASGTGGDPTVASGAASYVWDTTLNVWTKVSEYESLDVVQSWANLTGKPSSSPAAIDTAVGQAHTHTNKATLDKFSEVSGVVYYNGDPVKAWSVTNW